MRVNIILALIVASLSASCVGLQGGAREADLQPSSNGVTAIMAADSPVGLYSLETTGGQVISRNVLGAITQYQRLEKTTRPGVSFSVNINQSPEAQSCLQIRRPDNQLVRVGLGGQVVFKLPAFEAAYIQQVEIKEIQQAIWSYPSNQRIAGSNPGSCVPPGVVPAACQSEEAAIEAVREPCFLGNFACSGLGVGAGIYYSKKIDESNAGAFANLLLSNGCSLLVDKIYNLESDPLIYLRSIIVSASAELLYKSVVNSNPSAGETVALSLTAGIINFGLCLQDAAAQCRVQNATARAYSQMAYQSCVQRQNSYRVASVLISKYGSPDQAKKILAAKQERVRQLHAQSSAQKVPLIRQVLRC